MERDEQQDLVERARQGDPESYGRLVEAYGRAVLATAYSRIGDFGASEDVAQDAFLLGFEKLASLRNPKCFASWLLRITRNLCARWRRNEAYRRKLAEEAETLRERLGGAAAAGALETLETQQTKALLRSALERLSHGEREALLLYYFHRKSAADAARIVGASPAAMRKRIQRARDQLREMLTAEIEDGLNAAADEERLKSRFLAATPVGAAFSKVADAARVVPASSQLVVAQLWGRAASMGSQATLLGSAVCMALVVVAGIQIRAHREGAKETPSIRSDSATEGVGTMGKTTSAAREQDGDAGTRSISAPASAKNGAATVGTVRKTGHNAALLGTVRDPSGNAVSAASVEARRKHERNDCEPLARDVVAATVTDDAGAYRLEALPEDEEILVLVSHEAWGIAGRTVEMDKHPGEGDFVLRKPATVTGVVVDEAGEGLADAAVSVGGIQFPGDFKPGANPDGDGEGSVYARDYGGLTNTVTDAQGRFVFCNLPADATLTTVSASKEGHGMGYAESKDAFNRMQADFASRGATRWSNYDIPLPADALRIVLKRAGALEGKVLRTDDQSVEGIGVCIKGSIPSSFADGVSVTYRAHVQTTADGVFRFTNVPPIQLDQIEASCEGFSSDILSARISSGAVEHVALTLGASGGFAGTLLDAATGRPVVNSAIQYVREGVYGVIPEVRTDGRGRSIRSYRSAGGSLAHRARRGVGTGPVASRGCDDKGYTR